MASSLLSLKQLHLISMGEPGTALNSQYPGLVNKSLNASDIFDLNRTDFYTDMLKRSYDQLSDLQHQFKRMDQLHRVELGMELDQDMFQHVRLLLLGSTGSAYQQNGTLDFGISSMISHLGSLSESSLKAEEIPLDIHKYLIAHTGSVT